MTSQGRIAILVAALTVVVLTISGYWLRSGKSASAYEQEARAAIARRDFVDATDLLEHAVRIAPQQTSAWLLLAENAARTSQSARACEALETAAQFEPTKTGTLAVQLGSRWMTNNDIQPAIRALRLATVAIPQSPDAYRLLAQIYGVIGNRHEVVRCLIELLKRDSFTRPDLIVLTSVNPTINDPQRLQAMVQTNPADKSPLLPLAMQELDRNNIENAKKLLIEIVTTDADNDEAQGILGELLAEFLPGEFLAWHGRLSLRADENARIWLARAKWLNAQGNTPEAVRCLLETLAREPENLSAAALVGQLLKSLGDGQPGEFYTERSRHLQRILDLSERMTEPRADEAVVEMINELETVGRYWEAWGWCVVSQTMKGRSVPTIIACRERFASRLNLDLPRTDPASLTNIDRDRLRYPLPDWSKWSSDTLTPSSLTPQRESTIRFEDRAERAGVDFRYVNSSKLQEGRKIYETMGAGVAVLDYDRDGWPDLYFPQGAPQRPDLAKGPSDALYRNLLGEQYHPVTDAAGVHEPSYSQGVAAGDYDNDGFPDVYIANLGHNGLFHNNGDGTYTDITDTAGIRHAAWTVSCAMADLNGDGLPELFDVNYVQGKGLLTATCFDEHRRPVVCRPTVFDAALDTVSINLGDGRFESRQQEAGLDLPLGRGLGLVIADFNDDDRPDVFIANDMTANFLLINETRGPNEPLHFRDEAYANGVAVDANGLAQACMGIACADINRDGGPDLYITNFARESNTLYLSQSGGLYQDRTQPAGLREPSFAPLGFGTQFLDADRDGWSDLVVVNGHIDEFVNEPFHMKAQIFHGQSDGRFTELAARQAGSLFDELRLARGLALLDWNRDGRTDFVATDLERPALLAENTTEVGHHALRLKLIGTQSSRDAIGAKVKILVVPGDERVCQLTAGDGYESSNERVLEVGLGSIAFVQRIVVRWPSGTESRFENVAGDMDWVIIEGRTEPLSLRRH